MTVSGSFAVPSAAAEFHYWRHSSLHWPRILDLLRSAGMDAISTFVCWDHHELAPGDFDFDGRTHSTRDLASFIDRCNERGLRVLLRVGPIIDAEWPTRGPAPDVATLERLHPTFLKRTKEYLRALSPVVLPRLRSAGGPIDMIGLDSEAYFPYSADAASDTSSGSVAVEYDRTLVLKLFQDWLAQRYGSVDQLAAAWGRPISSESFAAVEEPRFDVASRREIIDGFRFIEESIQSYFGFLLEVTQELGWHVPTYTNLKQYTHYIGVRSLESVVELVGMDYYPPNSWTSAERLTSSWYVRVGCATSRYPWSSETQAGTSIRPLATAAVTGIPLPDHGWVTTASALALGVRGVDYFMFVERDDWHYSPISPIGKQRPQLDHFRAGAAAARLMASATHIADVALLWSLEEHRLHLAKMFASWTRLHEVRGAVGGPMEADAWWSVFSLLHESDVDFDVVDVESSPSAHSVLIVPYAEPLAPQVEAFVKRWVARKGKILSLIDVLTGRHSKPQAQPSAIAAKLVKLGIRPVVSSNGEGSVWTSAFKGDDGLTFFAVNATGRATVSRFLVRDDIAAQVRGRLATNVRSGEQWIVADEHLGLGNMALSANEVVMVHVPLDGGRRAWP